MSITIPMIWRKSADRSCSMTLIIFLIELKRKTKAILSYMERDTLIREVETKYPQKRNEPVSPYEEEYEDYSEVEPPDIKTGGM